MGQIYRSKDTEKNCDKTNDINSLVTVRVGNSREMHTGIQQGFRDDKTEHESSNHLWRQFNILNCNSFRQFKFTLLHVLFQISPNLQFT